VKLVELRADAAEVLLRHSLAEQMIRRAVDDGLLLAADLRTWQSRPRATAEACARPCVDP